MSLAHDSTPLGIVPATVYAVGENAQYIVLKQHPYSKSTYDKSVTNYYVVRRSDSTNFREVEAGVQGPLDEAAFAKLAAVDSLPAFSKTFNDLK